MTKKQKKKLSKLALRKLNPSTLIKMYDEADTQDRVVIASEVVRRKIKDDWPVGFLIKE